MQSASAFRLSKWIWLWGPIALLLLLLGIIVFFPVDIMSLLINREGGLVELGTPLLCVLAVIAGLFCMKHLKKLPAKWLMGWLMLVTAASFYFGGEEISWGQQLYHWQTPEYMKEINDQKETNIHNISSWFDQKPRILLELWVLIGGIYIPLKLLIKKTNYSADDWRYWFWPAQVCLPTGIIAIGVKLPERYRDFLGGELPYHLPMRYSELQELFFAYFLMVYLLASYEKLVVLNK
jgi:hypothetical protein